MEIQPLTSVERMTSSVNPGDDQEVVHSRVVVDMMTNNAAV
jgi:hypothetical protein